MRSNDPALAARELIFGRVKLCGLNRPEDFAAAKPATYAGLVFVAGSPRSVTLGQALRLAPLHPKPVGVFRNGRADEVSEVAGILGLAAVQLHGEEDADYTRNLARLLPHDCEVWKALEVGKSPPAGFDAADRILFDSGSGGTGRTFDWTRIGGHPALKQALIAGGIGPHNAQKARRLGAHAIDVGSSLDELRGCKSPQKIGNLFDALRPIARQQLRACA